MPDYKSTNHEHHHCRRCVDAVVDWENEGGSLWQTPDANAPGSDPFTGSSDPDFALLDALPLGILITDKLGEITYSNSACQRMSEVSAAALAGFHWCRFVDARDHSAVPHDWHECDGRSQPLTFEVRVVTGSGRRIWTRHSIARLGRVSGAHIHTIEDIDRTRAAEQARRAALKDLSRERERARVTLECIGDAVISTNAMGRVTYLNSVAEQLTGWSREEAGGEPLDRVFRVIDPDSGEPIDNLATRAMRGLEIVQMPSNCVLLRPDGGELAIEDSAAPILDKTGRLTGAVVIFRDRRLSRENTARMAYLARHDALTGLPNRVAFAEHFDQALKLARRHHKRLGLLFIDLDQFKQVNDRLGHSAGDRLLKELSRRLSACVRDTDIVCRYGGDEFVVLLNEIKQPRDAGRVALKMSVAATEIRHLQGCKSGLELSIGISLYPEDGTEMGTLMQRADVAMYHAKLDVEKAPMFFKAGMKRPTPPSNPEDAVNAIQHAEGPRSSGR